MRRISLRWGRMMHKNDFHPGDLVLYTAAYIAADRTLAGYIGRVLEGANDPDLVKVGFILPEKYYDDRGWECYPQNLKLLARKEELIHE